MPGSAYGRRVTSSRLEPPTHTTGAHRANRRAPRPAGMRPTLGQTPPARYEAHLDGLFTYCLSVLCDHDAATAALGDVLAVSERQFARCPADEAGRRAWLYALARWACLRALAERRRNRQGAHGRGAHGQGAHGQGAHSARPPAVSGGASRVSEEAPRVPADVLERQRAELARLAWPEAAGTTPEQREALELAVRHQLGPREVAAVLGMPPAAARELLASAACEVERTSAALAVVEKGNCPSVARLAGDHQVLLSATLRRELVRHVDDCPRCRRAAERVQAAGPWPGSAVTPARLPLVPAPRAAAYVAMLHAPRTRAGAPRFGRDGFPMDPKDHAARRDRLRARALTTTVVATVVAAPVLALWAAYRGAPLTGEGHGGASVSAGEAGEPHGLEGGPYGPYGPYDHYENAGNARTEPDPPATAGGPSPAISVEVVSPGLPPGSPSAPGHPGSAAPPGQAGPGRLTVSAQPSGSGDTTMITLTATGGAAVAWTLWTDAPWLYADVTSGTLHPGETVTVYVSVDHSAEPAGAWSARVGVDPSGAVLEIDGHGATPPPSPSEPTPTPTPTPTEPEPSTDPSPLPPPSSPSVPTSEDPGTSP
ncbi:hypothetical protein [Streptomyces sp. NPDC000410]|uniref:BACON domain-containing protein n=1 Tax=Streptomyces sp. NPDC000410 TaxID=3154254 RepID=UPI00332CA303